MWNEHEHIKCFSSSNIFFSQNSHRRFYSAMFLYQPVSVCKGRIPHINLAKRDIPYNPDHMTLWFLEVVPVVYARVTKINTPGMGRLKVKWIFVLKAYLYKQREKPGKAKHTIKLSIYIFNLT